MPAIHHILNGDALCAVFPELNLPGEIIVVREALVTGDLRGNDDAGFWLTRSEYLNVPLEVYRQQTVSQFEAILSAAPESEFNLWFEFDLFCQVNMWFVLSLIDRLPGRKSVYAVYSSPDDSDPHFWNGFGKATRKQLEISFSSRVRFTTEDVTLGTGLWKAYKENDLVELTRLSRNGPGSFPHLKEVVNAHVDRFPSDGRKGRPEEFIRGLFNDSAPDFKTVLAEFTKKESIYGFGDTQVKELFDQVMRSIW